jgi:DNA invertase Pin-like site-specific DNA recombinase
MAARKASKKKAAKKKKGTWGGRRPGAGRPKGSGKGPSPNSRRNRVAVMLTDAELRTLRGVARKQGVPVSTAAYQYIAKSLGKTKS